MLHAGFGDDFLNQLLSIFPIHFPAKLLECSILHFQLAAMVNL
jgi:hypothetical protein